ncbi:MAG TPA: alpha/beta fold hydrolase [Bryobacteraceae bacterium]|nr:alpha/beta fold hydrolase [Bryobacteraceae bacterium]
MRPSTFTCILPVLAATCCFAQQPAGPFQPPPDVSYRKADIWSAGTRMSAEVFAPNSTLVKNRPTILMAHGWGGTASGLRRDAVAFAHAGYLVVTFDYRGWGPSDSRLILTGPAPAERPNHKFTAEVKEVREIVDPLDQAEDWLNAIHWLQAEPLCDTNRIGLWGSSFSGGLVVYAAERDHRVKAIHSQVGYMNGNVLNSTPELRKLMYDEATKRARGELGYPDPLAKVVGNLRGGPIRDRFTDYDPGGEVDRAPNCAMQFVLAENEELFDNKDQGVRAYNRAKGPKNMVVIPRITHYGIYTEAWAPAHKLAQDWFDKYLKQ